MKKKAIPTFTDVETLYAYFRKKRTPTLVRLEVWNLKQTKMYTQFLGTYYPIEAKNYVKEEGFYKLEEYIFELNNIFKWENTTS